MRNIKPGLIQTKTMDKEIGKADLLLLAELSIFLFRDILPSTKCFKDALPLRPGPQSELLSEFARQLGLEDEDAIKAFRTAGIAIAIAGILLGHKDRLNAKGKDDTTIQMNVSLVVKDLPKDLQELVVNVLGSDVRMIPISFLFYPRQCVINYENKMQGISNYSKLQPHEAEGRTHIVNFLNDVGSSLDYNSTCFTQAGFLELSKIVDATSTEFPTPKAAVDKMVRIHR